jgi:PAS domain S-box-containing protein
MLNVARASKPTSEDADAMREYLRFYQAQRATILANTLSTAVRGPEWSNIQPKLSADLRAAGYALQIRAVFDNEWEPFEAHLQQWGEWYANAGISYAGWFDFICAHRETVLQHLEVQLAEDPKAQERIHTISRGIHALTDLTAQRIAEGYLKTLVARPEERYRLLFERNPLPMWMYDRDTLKFVMVNDAAVEQYGYSKDELSRMTIADIRPEEDRPEQDRKVWRHRKKDGTIVFVEVKANDFVSDGKNVRLVVINDVTERLKAELELHTTQEQLRQSQKMEAVGRLAGGVAHDFNNVLQVVQVYACLLESSIDADDERHEDAVEIRRASERATAITRQLLSLSRHDVAEPRSLNLDDVVEGFLPMLRRLVGESVAITTQRSLAADVIADRGQIEQVLMNLAVNARDAMPDGGRLRIETRSIGPQVELAVTDSGSGIDAETQRRIFDPFFTTKEVGKGTGLGLSIVHGIVAKAGGSISVYSEPGHGSTFRVLLPVADAATAAPEAPQVVAPTTLPPIRVLVVDGQPDVRTVASRVLRDAGCQVLEAATAEEARRICVRESDAIDVVLLDVVLPGTREDSLVRQLHELRPSLKFVPMSGYPAGALTPSGTAPEDVLAKPFSPAELRTAIARVCGVTAERSEVAGAPSRGAPRRALVADDDEQMRGVVVRLLKRANFDVVAVDSGFRAISALESHPFDVVVSDVQMPDGGGLDLLRAVRRVDLDVPVILMTGEPSIAAAAAAVEYGAFRYLTKPLDTTGFVKTVEHAARVHALARLRREAYNVSGTHGGAIDRAGLEVRFDLALDGMWVAFQPIVRAGTGALFGVEALLRSTEPSLPNPTAILDAATQLGRLPMIGRRVRALASAAIASRTDDLTLFVNLHPDDLFDVDLLDAGSPLSKIASRVILEVTERASLDNSPALTDRITQLRELGFRLAVDDIGAGYSGLTSFTQLNPEVMKIDMSLVRDVHRSVLKQRTIGALCSLCKDVGTLVVAEGVETIHERDALVELGCDFLQGYLLGRPSRDLPER